MKTLGLRLDLATMPGRTIRENEWLQRIPFVVATLRKALPPADHEILAAKCSAREGEVTFVATNGFVKAKDFMKLRDILESILLFRKEDIESGIFR